MACQCHAGRLPEPDSLDDAFARVQKYHMNNIPHFPAVEVKQNALKSQIHRDSAQLIADNDFVETAMAMTQSELLKDTLVQEIPAGSA